MRLKIGMEHQGLSARDWEGWINAADPASLIVLIEDRMGASLRRAYTAEDVLQEALLHAWRSRGQLEWRGLKSFRNWLLSIIDNRIRDLADRESAQKRGGDRKPIALSDLRRDVASADAPEPLGSTTPSRLAMYREEAQIIRACLDTLPDDLREVVRLRLLEQTPIEEVASRLGISVSAARRRLRNGAEIYHARLRAALASRTTSTGGLGPGAASGASFRGPGAASDATSRGLAAPSAHAPPPESSPESE